MDGSVDGALLGMELSADDGTLESVLHDIKLGRNDGTADGAKLDIFHTKNKINLHGYQLMSCCFIQGEYYLSL